MGHVKMQDAPTFSVVRVVKPGSHESTERPLDLAMADGVDVVVWGTNGERSDDPFSPVKIRPVLVNGEPHWVSQDAVVEVVRERRAITEDWKAWAAAAPVVTLRKAGRTSPLGSGDRDAWPPALWHGDDVYSAAVPLVDTTSALPTLLWAAGAAWESLDAEARAMLQAAALARLASADDDDLRWVQAELDGREVGWVDGKWVDP